MPYTMSSPNLPANVRGMPEEKKKRWIAIFNSSMASGDSESEAFAKANGTKEYYGGHQLEQVSVNYDPVGMGKNGACAACNWFCSPDGCVLVMGDISPTGVCDLFLGKPQPSVDPIPVSIVEDYTQGMSEFVSYDGRRIELSEDFVRGVKELGEKEVWSTAYQNDLPDSSFAWIEPGGTKDSEGKTTPRSLRHLVYKDANGKVDKAHVDNALARFSQTQGVPSSVKGKLEAALASTKELSWWNKLLGKGIPTDVDVKAFSIKQVGDETRFYLRVSNNFEDRESQTFTLNAHKEYIAWADANRAYPELWIWHASKSRIGQADLLDLSNGILVASGVIDEDKKEIAERIVSDGELDGVSHGFLHKTVGNDIVHYRTYELSLLPRRFAANYVGGGTLLTKELDMAFSPAKREVLTKYFGDEQVKEMEADTDRLKADLEKLGVSSKEVDDSVSLAEQLAALTKSMADGFAAVGTAIGTMRTEVAEAKKSLDDRVEEVLLPKVKAGAVEGPASSKDNLIDEKADKELVAATKSGDWLTPFVQNIERGL